MPEERMTFKVENAELIYKNFSGKKSKYNLLGERNFCVVLDKETADQMMADGWHVRMQEPREEGDEPRPYIQVSVKYTYKPPRVTLISSTGRTSLDEDTIEVLDYADMRLVDLIAVASAWDINGKTGIKAYLKTMFVTIDEDDLERKYALQEQPAE